MPRPSLLKLSESERQRLTKEAAHGGHKQVRILCQAILMLADGRKRQEVAHHFIVHPVTIGRWSARYRRLGLAGLQSQTEGNRGRKPKISERHLEILKEAALASPAGLGKSFENWNFARLARYFFQQSGISITPHYAALLLKRMGILTLGHARRATAPQQIVVWFSLGIRPKKSSTADGPGERHVLYIGLELRSGRLTIHRTTRIQTAHFVEFLRMLLRDYSGHRVLLLAGAEDFVRTRRLEDFLKSHGEQLEVVSLAQAAIHPSKLRRRWHNTEAGKDFGFRSNSLGQLARNLEEAVRSLKLVFSRD